MAQSGTTTFLFSELIDSTQHLQTVGDEMGERSFRAHHKLMTEAITGCGGQELQWLGDGALAVFSSAVDAVRCAIAMQRTARRPVAGTRFELRIGVHTGEALRREGGYFGTPVVVARRLCDRSSSGQILCSALIAELLAARKGFSFQKLGKLELKGIPAPLETCEVVYQRNDPAALLSRTPFVGRAGHLSRLAAKLEEASNGRGGVAMLVGEAGIGKTRIVEEFADHAQQRAAIVLRGACYEGEWQPPYGPFAEAISEYARQADPAVLASVLSGNSSTLLKVAPALREWVTTSTEAPAMDKEEERFRVLDSVAQFFIAVARRGPLVLVLDDLHWAERGTVSVLAHVAHFVSSNRILLIGAYRDAEINRTHPLAAALAEMRRRAGFDSFALKGLGGDELAALLGMIGDSDAPHELVEAIGSETGGNPLFVREMLLHLVEKGELFEDGRWTSHFTVGELAITEGVREVIGRRMLRLSDPGRELLSVGAAFNGAFPFDIATRVAGLEEEAGLSAIDEAIEAKLLRSANQPDRFHSRADTQHALLRN
jgi:class 3 adenylate cyclase